MRPSAPASWKAKISRPASIALFDSARWFVEHDYVTSERAALINWNPPIAQ